MLPEHIVGSYLFVDMTLFTVCKKVYEEASVLFYNRGIFRFNSSQIGTLTMIPRILNHLQSIEIEDGYEDRRRWDLCSWLESLSALPEMRTIILGNKALGMDLNTSRKFLPRSKFRLFIDYTSTDPPTETRDDDLVEWSKLALRTDKAFDVWKSSQPLLSDWDLIDFYSRKSIAHAALDLERLPKVMVVNFSKRACLVRNVNATRLLACA